MAEQEEGASEILCLPASEILLVLIEEASRTWCPMQNYILLPLCWGLVSPFLSACGIFAH